MLFYGRCLICVVLWPLSDLCRLISVATALSVLCCSVATALSVFGFCGRCLIWVVLFCGHCFVCIVLICDVRGVCFSVLWPLSVIFFFSFFFLHDCYFLPTV